MTDAPALAWFCVKAKPRQEAVAVRNLRALGPVELVFPRIRRTRRGHEKNREVVEPLFPGYLFLRYDAAELNGQPVEVDVKVINELLALGPDAILSALDEELQIGAKVRIVRGIFAGSEGEVLRLETPQKRIAVLLSLLGSDQPVELSSEDVEGLPNEDV